MKIRLSKPYEHYSGVFLPAGAVLQGEDFGIQALIDAGYGVQVPDDTAARLNPELYANPCNPLPEHSAHLVGLGTETATLDLKGKPKS